jgi:hypothetical protein
VIVVKKLRGFIKGQFWWNHHQNARAKKFVHFSTTNGIAHCTRSAEKISLTFIEQYIQLIDLHNKSRLPWANETRECGGVE